MNTHTPLTVREGELWSLIGYEDEEAGSIYFHGVAQTLDGEWARRLVLAHNAHDALVKALKTVKMHGRCYRIFGDDIRLPMQEQVDAALKLAEE